MKLIVGLGNPGAEYAHTRHNVGAMVVERAAARMKRVEGFTTRFQSSYAEAVYGGERVGLLMPQTYMNLSGAAVNAARGVLGIAIKDILVVYDDVDIPALTMKLRQSGGDGGQRGMRHIIESLGTQDFPRLRMGIGRPPPRTNTTNWVLAPFDPAEHAALDALLDQAADCALLWARKGLQTAMNLYNKAPAPSPAPRDDRPGRPEGEPSSTPPAGGGSPNP